MPINEKRRRVEGMIKNKEWLKMFRQKNQMHDGNRESSKSLSSNIKFDYWTYIENKYFNKNPVSDRPVDYSSHDLVKLGQLPELSTS